MGPLYLIAHILTAKTDIYARPVPSAIAKALIPAACVGYLVPTALMFLPVDNPAVTQGWCAFWQPSPGYVAVLVPVFAAVIRRMERTPWEEVSVEKPEHVASLEPYKKKDVAPLLSAYAFVFAIAALVHVCTMAYIHYHADLTVWRVFFDLPNPLAGSWGLDATEGAFVFFKYDMVLVSIATVVFLLYTVWDTRRMGYVCTREAVQVVTAVVVGHVTLGPAATYAGVWFWRETVLASLGDSA